MNFPSPSVNVSQEQTERRLMVLAGAFLLLYAAALTLSPAVRVHSWKTTLRWEHWLGVVAWLVSYFLLYRQLNNLIPHHDPYLLPIASLLTGWGLLTIYRLDTRFGARQTIWLILGLVIIYLILRIPRSLDILRRYKYLWLSISLLVMALTFFFGTYPGGIGPRLWLGCCGVYVQPSEPLKILLIVYLAAYLSGQVFLRLTLPQLLAPTLVLVAAAILLLVAQRDLGTATLVITIYTIVVYMASGRRRVVFISLGMLLIATAAGYAAISVIKVRVDAWLNPWLDSAGKSYQLVQSFLAVATGRLFGTGPGLGSPGLVPVAQSDFITAAISEETGLIGLAGILLLVGLFVFRCLSTAMRASNNYQRFLAAGLGSYFGIQSILIIGGNLRFLPLTGVTLPFVSYGGSSLVTALAALGILLVVSSSEEFHQPELPRLRPYLVTGGGIALLLLLLGLTAGWWAVVRSDDLQFRTDNLRWTIHSRFVPRGSLLDRNNRLIAVTEGTPGNLTRKLLFPELGTTVGYSNPLFGKGGLEASLDGYLTGVKGNSGLSIWLAELIYSQPPPGLDVRLSIDLRLQTKLDESLKGHVGAGVVLNTQSGEIIAISSQPSFDPNQMATEIETWRNDPQAPLLNRVTQGAYPPGTILGPFLYNQVHPAAETSPNRLVYNLNGVALTCAVSPAVPLTWKSVVAAGCPGALVELGNQLSPNQMHQVFDKFGFYSTPEFDLPAAGTQPSPPLPDTVDASLGQSGLKVSPLQLALAVAQLGEQGARPAPRLATAVKVPDQGWVVLPAAPGDKIPGDYVAPEGIKIWPQFSLPIWDAIGRAQTDDQKPLTWYIGATINSWPGSPLALVLILEENNPDYAIKIGHETMSAALNP